MSRTTDQSVDSKVLASRNFVLLLVIVFFTTFASSMVSGSAVIFLVKSLAGTMEATTAFIGVMVAVSSVAMIAGNFLGGFLADSAGRKRTITVANVILVPSLLVYSIVPSVFLAVLVYFLHMLAMSMFQPAFTAFVADLSRLACALRTRFDNTLRKTSKTQLFHCFSRKTSPVHVHLSKIPPTARTKASTNHSLNPNTAHEKTYGEWG